MDNTFESVSTNNDKIVYFQTMKEKLNKKFQIELAYLLDELMDYRQQKVAWMIYDSMKDSYSIDAVGFSLELWCNYCDEIDPIIDNEGKYAASIELFVSQLLLQTPFSKKEIVRKYGLNEEDQIVINI
ncbi:hypothetical protein [Calidifontibacillus oryziterrae]|uniref:hypothetical protein n=1 Tax=Calidifontibacillus oryziterrae TaxID=1191699 RepID=UPI00030710EC|nr:hypothetical protein [Calidifontibacillus oryziterrae]